MLPSPGRQFTFDAIYRQPTFPCGSAGKESACNAGEAALLGRSPGEGRKRLPTPVFWPEEFHGLYSPLGHKKSNTTE